MKKFNLAAMALVLVAGLVNNGTGLAGDRHSAGMSHGGGRSVGNAGFQMPAQSRGASPVQGGGNRVMGAGNLSHSQAVPQSPVKTAPVNTSPIRTAPPVKVTQPSVGGQNTGAGDGRKIFVPPAQTTGGRIGLPPIHPARGNENGGSAATTSTTTGGNRVIFPGLPGGRDQTGAGTDKRHPPIRHTPENTGTGSQGPVVIVDPGRNTSGGTNPPSGPTGPGNGGNHPPRSGHGGCVVICPPYIFPTGPVSCLPCPPVFNNWCWFPGYGDCYGYCGGVGLPVGPVAVSTVSLAVREVVARQSVVRVVPGTRVVANLESAGIKSGRVVLQYGDIAMNATVESWSEGSVSFEVPALALKHPVEAQLLFLKENGELLETVQCELSAAEVQQAS